MYSVDIILQDNSLLKTYKSELLGYHDVANLQLLIRTKLSFLINSSADQSSKAIYSMYLSNFDVFL